jgi:hypothetical protein
VNDPLCLKKKRAPCSSGHRNSPFSRERVYLPRAECQPFALQRAYGNSLAGFFGRDETAGIGGFDSLVEDAAGFGFEFHFRLCRNKRINFRFGDTFVGQ